MKLPQSYYNSKVFFGFWLLPVSMLITVCSFMLYLLLRRGSEVFHFWLGWLFVTIFGLLLGIGIISANVMLRRLFSKAPRLTLTNSGIADYTQKVGEIPWLNITGAYLRYTKGGALICLNLRNTDEYVARLSFITRLLNRPNQALGFTPITLSLIGVKANANDVLAIIKLLAAQNR